MSQADLFQARVGMPRAPSGRPLFGSLTRVGPLAELGGEQTWQYLCPVCLIPETFRGYSREQARAAVLPKHASCQAALEPETPAPPAGLPGAPPASPPGLASTRGYKLGGETFSSKKAIALRCKELLHRGMGPIVNAKETAFLRDLVNMHPQAASKIGVGIASFEVRPSANFNTPNFVYTRTDGSRGDISYKVCLEPWRSSPEACAKSALRNEVSDQTTGFLRDAMARGDLVDAVTGRPVGNEKPEVDHAPPTFAELVAMWLATEGLTLAQLVTAGHGDGEDRLTLLDRTIASRWQAFHQATARLQIVTHATNQALIRQRRGE